MKKSVLRTILLTSLFIVSCFQRDKPNVKYNEISREIESLVKRDLSVIHLKSKIDSIVTLKKDTSLAILLHKFSSYLPDNDKDYFRYKEKAKNIFNDLNHDSYFKESSYHLLKKHFDNDNFDEVIKYSNDIIQSGIGKTEKDKSNYLKAIMAQAIVLRKTGNPNESLSLYSKYENQFLVGSKEYYMILHNKAILYEDIYDLKALYQIRDLQLNKYLVDNNPTGISLAKSGLGYISNSLGDYTSSIKHYKEALSQAKLTKDKYLITIQHYNLIESYILNSNYELANNLFNEFKELKLPSSGPITDKLFRILEIIIQSHFSQYQEERNLEIKKIRNFLLRKKAFAEVINLDIWYINNTDQLSCDDVNYYFQNIDSLVSKTNNPLTQLSIINFQIDSEHCFENLIDKNQLYKTKDSLLLKIATDKDYIINSELSKAVRPRKTSFELSLYFRTLFCVLIAILCLIIYFNRKNKNKELKLIEKKFNDYYSSINHDLKKPLNHFISQLKENSNNLSKYDIAVKLDSFKNQIQKYSQIFNLKKDEKIIDYFDLPELLFDIYKEIGSYKEVKFTVKPKEISINSDILLCRILFTNLIENAIKFSSENHPVVEVEIIELTEKYVISVIDNGKGFPRIIPKSFDAGKTYHTQKEGSNSGLGLFISSKIIQILDGQMLITNIGRCTKVQVILLK